jgi:FMN reductase
MTVSETNDSIRITGVCGSLSADGATRKALAIALKGAAEYDVEIELLELRDFNLVFCGSVPQDEYPPDVIRLRQVLKNSQGIILATPEYHGSLTGALKNMLDLMSIEEFETKIIGLVGVAGGHIGAINSLNTMKTICRNLHCWVLPQEVSIANSSQTFNDDGTVKDSEIEERLLNVGRQLVKFVTMQQTVRQDDFMKMWKSLPTW